MNRILETGLIRGTLGVLAGVMFGLSIAADALALPPAGPPNDAAPKRRPGVEQIKPEALDAELEDPEAARRAQFFGAMPPLPFPGMVFPGFPQPAFPFVPPGAGAGAGNAQGGGGVQQFGFSGAIIVGGGNAVPGANGFVIRTWQIGPDGVAVEIPPADPRAAAAGQPRPDRKAGPRGAKRERKDGVKDNAEDNAEDGAEGDAKDDDKDDPKDRTKGSVKGNAKGNAAKAAREARSRRVPRDQRGAGAGE